MKTAKRLTAIFLCIAMLFGIGATSAFADDTRETIEWKYTEDDIGAFWIEEYPFGGALTEGYNDVEDLGDPYSVCYEFNAAKDGYYKVSCPSHEIYGISFAKTYENGMPVDNADRLLTYGETETRIFNLDAGKNLLVVYYNEENPAGTSIKIDYIAESITDVAYDEGSVDELIIGYDVYSDENTYYVDCGYTVTFSNGQTVEYKNDKYNEYTLNILAEKNWVKGENAAKIVLPGYEKEITITVSEIADYVSSIELSNINKYLEAYEYYNYTYGYYDFGETPETVTVTYADGTKKTFEYYYNDTTDTYNTYITLPNGKDVYVYIYQRGTGTERVLVAGIADNEYIAEKCNIIPMDFSTNFNYLTSNIRDWIRYGANDIKWHLESIVTASSFEMLTYHFSELFNFFYISNIFEEIEMFISNCF